MPILNRVAKEHLPEIKIIEQTPDICLRMRLVHIYEKRFKQRTANTKAKAEVFLSLSNKMTIVEDTKGRTVADNVREGVELGHLTLCSLW